ncbi:MAG: endonuclease I family protein [Alphaproteobacteria bacterium]
MPLTDVDPENNNNIILFYGHVSVSNASSNWNREHVWPKSLGWFNESGAGSDVHHLRPENEGVNSTRGNMKMGKVTNGTVCKYPDGTIAGYYGNRYFEPNDCSKGDVARIFFYMLIRYSETDSNYPITKTAQSLELMLEWHLLDPVDDLERVRNERAYQYQGNRNPFIDYPEFAEVLWG